MTNGIGRLEKEVQRDFQNGGPLMWKQATVRPNQADLAYVDGNIFNYKTDKHGDIPLEKIMIVAVDERKRRVDDILARFPRSDLNRVADVLLYDKIYNPSLSKMTDEEYPIMSDRQYERRESKEISSVDKRMGMNAADGQPHEKPNRRVRNEYENLLIDRKARSRNKERRQKYNEFTKVQPVTTWNLRENE